MGIIVLLCTVSLPVPGPARGRERTIAAGEIKALEKSGIISRVDADTWRTRGGLLFRGRDPKGITRLEHVMRHSVDNPKRKKHGVFSLDHGKIIALMDRLWKKIESKSVTGEERGGRIAYTWNSGNVIGYLGGKKGREKGFPKLRSLRLVLKSGTSEVVTCFPL